MKELSCSCCLHTRKAFSLNTLTDEAHAGLTSLVMQVLRHTGADTKMMVVGNPVGTSTYRKRLVRATVLEGAG
jgi:hypothetical protein